MNEIEKKAYEAYPKECGKAYHSEFGTIEFDRNAELREGYIKCAEEYESLSRIHAWLAKDGDGSVRLFFAKPEKNGSRWEGGAYFYLGKAPCNIEVTKSNPVKVELLMRKIEND